jgi:hypothetical protein
MLELVGVYVGIFLKGVPKGPQTVKLEFQVLQFGAPYF